MAATAEGAASRLYRLRIWSTCAWRRSRDGHEQERSGREYADECWYWASAGGSVRSTSLIGVPVTMMRTEGRMPCLERLDEDADVLGGRRPGRVHSRHPCQGAWRVC